MHTCFSQVSLLLALCSMTAAMRAAHFPRSEPIPHLSHHNLYVAGLVQPYKQQLMMNHEAWYTRKSTPLNMAPQCSLPETITARITVATVPATNISSSSAVSTMTSSSTAFTHAESSTPQNASISNSTNQSNESTFAFLPVALAIQASPPQTAEQSDWMAATDAPCTKALLHTHSSSDPSGMTPCYNILNLSASDHTFAASLLLYQISLPQDKWTSVKSKEMSIGFAFNKASLDPQLPRRTRKRDNENAGDAWTGQGGASWGAMRKQSGMKPRRIAALRLHGNFDPPEDGTLQEALTPSIRLSAINQDGEVLTTDLNSTDGFFVTGVFAISRPEEPKPAERAWPPDVQVIIREGNRIEASQVFPLVVGCVCAVTPLLVEAWSLWIRWKCRREWKARMKRGERNAITVVSYY